MAAPRSGPEGELTRCDSGRVEINAMKNITYRTTVDCNLTAEQWQLFAAMAGADAAAEALNLAVNTGCNAPDATRASACRTISDTQRKYSKLGATDSEPYYVVDCILDKVFGPCE